jgi:mannan endo-1,4-beta-mannosidase
MTLLKKLCLFVLVSAVWIGCKDTARAVSPRETMYVQGRFLYDPCGEKVVLRGFNAMIIYWDPLGKETYPQVAETGANACRIFWTVKAEKPPSVLEKTLANCRAEGMIPIPCVWDATGKWENFEKCVDYWCRPEIVAVLQKHQDCLLVNIANEAGKGDVTQEEFRNAYREAIVRMRKAGLHMPLVIDAANWGRGEEYLIENANHLIEVDPDSNLLFSWHPWDTNQPRSRYREAIDASIEKNFCFIIGEFSQLGVFYKKPIDYRFIIEQCREKEIGWLAWVWTCGKVGDPDKHSVSKDRRFGHWANPPWGKTIAVESPYSVKATSERTYYLEHGTCRPE